MRPTNGFMPEFARPSRFVTATVFVLGAAQLVLGLWCLLDPRGFAHVVRQDYGGHFVKDAGAFQIGLGTTLMAILLCRDPYVIVLTGFVVGNSVHAAGHYADLPIGGHPRDVVLLASASVLAAAACLARWRQTAASKAAR